ncbi:unnamed protein product [Cyprideis torosa]|uniref:Uncharacterized protein n=1 Tax=Cyprideis torosa TaxID=163714 RepID=A0A7R8WMR3_9CRUS|nr:unnamed protein product [Cyprideis torosa]CAG0899677.1 unnamed protein product [Cyprideis torosa]
MERRASLSFDSSESGWCSESTLGSRKGAGQGGSRTELMRERFLKDQVVFYELPAEKVGDYEWDYSTQGLILSSFFWGYILTQLPGAIIGRIYSPKWLLGTGIFVTALGGAFIPLAADVGYGLVLFCRFIQGLGSGFVYPNMHALLATWVPVSERGSYISIIYGGSSLGSVLIWSSSGFISSSFLSWRFVFYLTSGVSFIWFFFWAWLIYDAPFQHPSFTDEEKALAKEFNPKPMSLENIPFLQILTSPPFLAIAVAHFGKTWGFYTIMTELPTYLAALNVNLKYNGILSSLPFFSLLVSGQAVGISADYIYRHKLLGLRRIRKTYNTLGFVLPAIVLFSIYYLGCNVPAVVLAFSMALGTMAFAYSGFEVNHIDLAPDFAGVCLGITNTVATLSGIIAPYSVGKIIHSEQTLERWNLFFLLSTIILVSTNSVYILLASAKEQRWGRMADLALTQEREPPLFVVGDLPRRFSAWLIKSESELG